MGRFRDRVLDLQRHFGQANADIEKILTSSEKITSRGRRIENLDFAGDEAQQKIAQPNGSTPSPTPRDAQAERPRSAGPRIIRQPDLLAGK
jgi:DNA recombination protein RmuC